VGLGGLLEVMRLLLGWRLTLLRRRTGFGHRPGLILRGRVHLLLRRRCRTRLGHGARLDGLRGWIRGHGTRLVFGPGLIFGPALGSGLDVWLLWLRGSPVGLGLPRVYRT